MSIDRSFVPPPAFRALRVFAVDPGMTARFETTVMNEMTVRIPWEELEPGPAGEYVAVIDEDENGTLLHPPIDLNRPEVLAQKGLPPSDGSPQFRQQMVYAVAMKTIRNFERALGRPAHWPPERQEGRRRPAYRKRLRLYPHYMPAPNAFYIEDKGLCFGYFVSLPDSQLSGTTVFMCLSQDVISHQLSHALLSGMNLQFSGDPGSDDAALSEAFSDLIALFQHFGEGDVLREQIMTVRGNLDERSQLGAVALQMGQALGQPDGLRNALGSTDEHGVWHPRRPDPRAYRSAMDPHARGDVLVGAVFEAFKKIYESRVADLRRIATKGTGVLPQGHLHPDLIDRLTHEASESARHVLHMCIRALDFLPPVHVTFGDYLRAIVTADYDLAPADERRYRVAFMDAFRSYGILPAELGTLSVETLLLCEPPSGEEPAVISEFVQELSKKTTRWNLPREREARWEVLEGWKRELARRLRQSAGTSGRLAGVDLSKRFEVRSLDLREPAGPGGVLSPQWVVKIVQRGGAAGCTLLVDADSGKVRYLVEKPARDDGGKDLLKRAGPGATPVPTERCLRVFAFDPSLGVELESAGINEVVLQVPWERDASGADLLEPGPVGEYVEVVDRDPASECFYRPVDLNERSVVAQDGLAPSESNPQFHQQMVYAVTMRIIRDFERSLGRLALWSPHRVLRRGEDGETTMREEFVRRLRIHPHALREANAYYSPEKKALLFGYFPAPGGAGGPQLTVFTCLSHDIVAHEVTHALLDGIHRRFNEPSNPDVLAFHEAFADIVALFEHFSLPEVLRHQIAATRGDLASQNRLGELAQQFGQAIGRRGALRSAIGEVDPETGHWRPIDPDPEAYQRVKEPHERGAILVAAVFDAFLTTYKSRVADLLRIATGGTGVLPAGHLHPDLVNRLADEAARSARRVLEMCIRALDYCPPVDITFGDYLRAVVTADFENDPVDDAARRVAFVEAFRRYGIVPEGIRTLSVDGLLWRPASAAPEEDEDVVLSEVESWAVFIESWSLTQDRHELFKLMRRLRAGLHSFLERQMEGTSAVLSGIDPTRRFEVHSIRPSLGIDWKEEPRFQWVIELTQRIPQYIDPDDDRPGATPDFYFRGGCTLLVDARTGKVRYSIKKPLDEARRERQRRYVLDEGNESLAATYFGGVASETSEPFAALHRF
ncbi:MAG: hypothetical protein ACR2ML_05740 [Solirubrobacteraceae bacterium]